MISINDIKEYLATLTEDQEVGIPQHKSQCLAARTIRHKHPGVSICMGPHNYDNKVGSYTVELPEDVHTIAEKFDDLWEPWDFEEDYGEPITKSVLRERMPELFS